MVYCVSDNDVLLHSVQELGIDISKEEIESIISEVSEKYQVENDIDKMHPLTRAFINLAKNQKTLDHLTIKAL